MFRTSTEFKCGDIVRFKRTIVMKHGAVVPLTATGGSLLQTHAKAAESEGQMRGFLKELRWRAYI